MAVPKNIERAVKDAVTDPNATIEVLEITPERGELMHEAEDKIIDVFEDFDLTWKEAVLLLDTLKDGILHLHGCSGGFATTANQQELAQLGLVPEEEA